MAPPQTRLLPKQLKGFILCHKEWSFNPLLQPSQGHLFIKPVHMTSLQRLLKNIAVLDNNIVV